MALLVGLGVVVVELVLRLAGYTYGPLLGLFAFGLLTRRVVVGVWVPIVCVAAPLVCLGLNLYLQPLLDWLFGAGRFSYRFGYELLALNGLLTYLGLWVVSGSEVRRAKPQPSSH